MQNLLFGAYQTFCLVLFLYLSAVLLYHRLIKRWVAFSIGFLALYCLGGYVFFGKLPIPSQLVDILNGFPLFLFFFGSIACLAFCLFKHFTLRQTAGAIIGYCFLLLAVTFLAGNLTVPGAGAIEGLLLSAPYVLLCVGPFIVVGWGLSRGLFFIEILGAVLVFCFSILLLTVITSTYFDRPWGFDFALAPYSAAWVEIGSILLLMFGVPVVVGYGLLNHWCLKELFGGVIVFLAIAGLVVGLVGLTLGYQFLGRVLAATG